MGSDFASFEEYRQHVLEVAMDEEIFCKCAESNNPRSLRLAAEIIEHHWNRTLKRYTTIRPCNNISGYSSNHHKIKNTVGVCMSDVQIDPGDPTIAYTCHLTHKCSNKSHLAE